MLGVCAEPRNQRRETITHRCDELERRFDGKLNFERVPPNKSATQEKSGLQLKNFSSAFLGQDHGTITPPRNRLSSASAGPMRGGLDADDSSLRSQTLLANNTPDNTAIVIVEHRAVLVHVGVGEAGM